ncbi:Lcl C-terminal domain-containing protein [Geofilum rhodophaeum]|uniref:Lcl C-terminal domain-containing protein n=1 Tax=Geofilum rhodophaeum TaxID=1965019 RepID=UPI001314C4D2|nr:DUF1566 domain-containing protein [Geofilum rhodophaeum]
MKKLFTFMVAVFLTATLWAQSPEKMSYQAVIRNSSEALVTNTTVGMQISILQGSASGTAVYVETQSPTTNANGLISIKIGDGTVQSGDFTNIEWANGPYFIKTETDPAGGTDYTITGTSQLLSVPYALHAKTAESVSGTITETDPVFTAWDKDYADLINTPAAADGSETKVTAGTNVTVTGSGTTASPYVVNATAGSGSTTFSVGDFAQGGIVFWVDETGQHGLVAAKEDQSTGVRWYAGTYGNTQAKGDGPFSGEANTSIIIAAQVAIGDDGSTYAARICNELQVTEGGKTYGDWYLPSKEELNLMYQNKATIDATAGVNGGSGFASAAYWSSTEYSSHGAWGQYFDFGSQYLYYKDITSCVRAVRAF